MERNARGGKQGGRREGERGRKREKRGRKRQKEAERGRREKEGEEKRKNSGWEVCETFINCLQTVTSTRYTHAHQVLHAEHMESSKMAKLKALARQRRAVLHLSVHESASEVNRWGGDTQVVSCHRYLVFHPIVEQLTAFRTSGLVLASSIFQVLDLDFHATVARWHPEWHMPKGT